jgi:type IV secretory pathway TrbL component
LTQQLSSAQDFILLNFKDLSRMVFESLNRNGFDLQGPGALMSDQVTPKNKLSSTQKLQSPWILKNGENCSEVIEWTFI